MTGRMPARDVERRVIGVNGPEVVVPGRVAAYLLRNAGLDVYRREHRGEDPEVDNTLLALTIIALHWRNTATGTRNAAAPELAASSEWLSTNQAATVLGLTERGIRKAIQEHRLQATRVGRTWRISREQLAHYQQRTGEPR